MIKNCSCCGNEFEATGRQKICPTCRKINNAEKARKWREKNNFTNIIVSKETAGRIKELSEWGETTPQFIERLIGIYERI